MYPYTIAFDELVERLGKSLIECTKRNGRLVPFENILIGAGIDISDSGDSRKCSAAMQVLRHRNRASYSKRYRAWVSHEVYSGKSQKKS